MNTLPIEVLATWPGWNDKVAFYRSQGHTLTGARNRAANYFRMYYNADGTMEQAQVVPGTVGINGNMWAPAQPAAQQFVVHDDAVEAPLNAADIDNFLNDLATTKKSKTVTVGDGKQPIQTLYSYPKLSYQKDTCIAYEKSVGLIKDPFEFVTNNGIIGIEVEVENVQHPVPLQAYWSTHEDGSLRNYGIEFVSVPLQVKQIQYAVDLLYQQLKTTNKPEFTNRTSVHIHLNCRDMTQDQIYTMVLLYAIFEKHFYGFAGPRRMNSIFCVPLFRCNLLDSAYDCIYRFSPKWHKYCGINLLPLVDNNGRRGYGTVEFRHLYGTDNKTEIFEWINTILCLRKAALEMSLDSVMSEIKSMNTNSSYLNLFSKVFPNIKMRAGSKDFEECISNIKREVFGTEFLNTLNKNPDSVYWKSVRERGIKG